jgi:hypothetical protein
MLVAGYGGGARLAKGGPTTGIAASKRLPANPAPQPMKTLSAVLPLSRRQDHRFATTPLGSTLPPP